MLTWEDHEAMNECKNCEKRDPVPWRCTCREPEQDEPTAGLRTRWIGHLKRFTKERIEMTDIEKVEEPNIRREICMKQCTLCKEIKSFNQFRFSKHSSDKKQAECNSCRDAMSFEDRRRLAAQRFQDRHREKPIEKPRLGSQFTCKKCGKVVKCLSQHDMCRECRKVKCLDCGLPKLMPKGARVCGVCFRIRARREASNRERWGAKRERRESNE